MDLDPRAILDSPHRCLLLLAGLLAILLPGLFRLEIDGSTRSMYPEKGKVFDWQREFSANFQTDTAMVVVFRADNIFAPETLQKLKDAFSRLESLEVVAKARHLFSIEYPSRGPNGFVMAPLVETLPEKAEEAGALREEVLSNPLLRGYLVNTEGTAAAVYPTLNRELEVPDFRKHVVETLEAFVASEQEAGMDVYLAGGPKIAEAVISHIWRDLYTLGPIALCVIALMFHLFFRWKTAVLFNLCTGILSVTATFGFMGWAGIEITSLVSIVMILVLIIGCTEDIHIVAEYILGLEDGLTESGSFQSMMDTVFRALFLTSFSTALGFYVTAINPVPALRNFAVACGTGILLNFLITILLAPVYLRARKQSPPHRFPGARLRHLILDFCSTVWKQHPRVAILALASVVALALAGLPQIVVDNNFLTFFKEDSPVRKSHDQLKEDFGGRAHLIITIETGKQQGAWRPDSISRIARFQQGLEDSFEQVSGFTNYLREYLYQTGRTTDRERGELSLTPDQIAICRAVFGKEFMGKYLDYDGSRTVIWTRSALEGSRKVHEAEETIAGIARSTLPGDWEVRVIGEPVATAVVTDSVTTELMKSLAILTVIICAILIFFFRSWRVGVLAMIPNLFPVLITFGFMGWKGIPMGTGFFAVAMAAFGIAVDDTIHLLVRFQHEYRKGGRRTPPEILHVALARELPPLLATSITLICGLGVLTLSEFQVHRETGLLFIIAISSALLADLFLTPLLLTFLYRREPSEGVHSLK